MFNRIGRIAVMFIAAMFFSLNTPTGVQAQESVKTMNVVSGNFGQGALAACYALPDDNQDTGCWIYNSTENHIGFHHPDGVGPTMYQPLKAGVKLTHLGVSDDGRFMTMILKDTTNTIVEVHTLLRRETRNQRLAGISTPRLYFRLVADGAQSASVAKGNLMVVFADALKVYEMRPRIFLPSVSGGGEVAPTPSACDEDPNCPGTPVVLPPGPRDTPEPFRCTGRSDDPPWCANRTPEPEFPTPAVATARP